MFLISIHLYKTIDTSESGVCLFIKIGALQSILSGGTNWATLDDTRKMAAKQAAEKLISEHLVAVFSKSYCPYCTQAKSVIAKLGLDQSSVGVLELDQMGSEGSDIQVSCAHTMKEKKKEMRLMGRIGQAYLMEKTSQRTVPNIFINKKHLGGCSDLLDAQKSGKLQQLLK